MGKNILSLFFINFLLFKLVIAISGNGKLDKPEILEFLRHKRIFANKIEDQREYNAILDKRRQLARIKFEEHCEPKGKILERICPSLEQCLPTSLTHDQIKEYSLRSMLEQKEKANQFLYPFNQGKRFFLSPFGNSQDNYKEKHVRERRLKGLSLYEDYCESTDRLPRACPSIDRCKEVLVINDKK